MDPGLVGVQSAVSSRATSADRKSAGRLLAMTATCCRTFDNISTDHNNNALHYSENRCGHSNYNNNCNIVTSDTERRRHF